MTSTPPATEVRTDIQGLRALAVGVVVAYHVFPGSLPGGFVGVDAFFAISGFLITAHLLQKQPRTGRDLLSFWSRRIRRLLPASLLVLATTLIAARLVAPETQWDATARQARAAALYVVNWVLARDSVDYLAAENAPTAVQHFWSLSVEEQFYLIWPIAILLLFALARALHVRRERLVVGAGLGLIAVASLAYSLHETSANAPAAYFITPTRIWELALGGLLAVAVAQGTYGRDDHPRQLPGPWGGLAAWLGLALIVWSAATYSSATPFPGYAALAPVLGAVLVMAGHSTRRDRIGPGRLLAFGPVQWLGDVSYSVYLWHWPLVVLVPAALGHDLGLVSGAAVIVATLALAALTKRFVEDPFRTAAWGARLRTSYALGAAGMAVVVALATLQVVEVDRRVESSDQRLKQELADPGRCFGANALTPGRDCPPVSYADLLPGPAEAAMDTSQAYATTNPRGRDCFSYLPNFPAKRCTFGKRSSDTTVALVGNSHAGQWLPAVQRIAAEQGFRVQTYLASRCAFATTQQTLGTPDHTKACAGWVERTVTQLVKDAPDLIVMSNRISAPAVGRPGDDLPASGSDYLRGYREVLERLAGAGRPVLVIRDTPASLFSVPDCVAENGDRTSQCDGTRAAWLPPEPALRAVKQLDDPRIRSVDLTDRICEGERCRAVNGGVITYFDGSHLTATYATTLAAYLAPAVRASLEP